MFMIILFLCFISNSFSQTVCNVPQSTIVQQNLQIVGNLLVNGYTNSSDFYATNCVADLCTVAAEAAGASGLLANGTFCSSATCSAQTALLANVTSPIFFTAYTRGTTIPVGVQSTIVFGTRPASSSDNSYNQATGIFTNAVGQNFFANYGYAVNVAGFVVNTTGSPNTTFPVNMTCGIYASGVLYNALFSVVSFSSTDTLFISNSGIVFISTTLQIQCTVSPAFGRVDFFIVSPVPINAGTFSINRITY
jgi:hypothetical protein